MIGQGPIRRALRVAGLGLWLVLAAVTTYVVFQVWLAGPACTRALPTTVQGRLCTSGNGWNLVVLLAVVASIFVPSIVLVRLWRRVGPWALLPVLVLTAAVPVVCTILLSLPPDS